MFHMLRDRRDTLMPSIQRESNDLSFASCSFQVSHRQHRFTPEWMIHWHMIEFQAPQTVPSYEYNIQGECN